MSQGAPTPGAPGPFAALRESAVLAATGVLFVVLPFARPGIFSVGGSSAQLADLALTGVWLCAIVAALRGRVKPRFDALFFATAAYLVALLVSMLAAHTLRVSRVVKLAAYAEMLLFPWLLSHFVQTRRQLGALVRAWTVGGALAVLVGLVGFVAYYVDRRGLGDAMMCGWGAIPSGNYPRLCAPFINQNMFLNYLTATFALAVVALARPLAGAASRGRAALAWGFLASVCFVGLFTLSAGVGGFAITAAATLVAWTRHVECAPGKRRLARGVLYAGAAVLAVFFMLTMVATLQPHGAGHLSIGSRDIKFWDGMRPSIWAGNRFLERPLTGLGYGEAPVIVTDPRAWIPPDRLRTMTGPFPPQALEAHSIPLSVLGQAGLLGFAGFCAVIATVTRGWLWGRLATRTPTDALLRTAIAAIFAGMVAYHGVFASTEEARHLWAFLGLGTALVAVLRRDANGEENS